MLLWLGVQSFERQREALATLRQEKLAAAIEARTRAAADAAFRVPGESITRHFFRMAAQGIVEPALHAPVPGPLPPVFLEAERPESSRPDLALALPEAGDRARTCAAGTPADRADTRQRRAA